MPLRTSHVLACFAVLSALFLAACGGDDTDVPPPMADGGADGTAPISPTTDGAVATRIPEVDASSPSNDASLGEVDAAFDATFPENADAAVDGGSDDASDGHAGQDAASTDDAGLTYDLLGIVSGLTGQNLALLNGGMTLAVASDGPFAFPRKLADGETYAVSVGQQPSLPTQTCTVTNASGTVAGGDVRNVAVACETDSFHVGGSISGLTGTVALSNNGGSSVPLSTNGDFIFPTETLSGSSFNVVVAQQPATQTCVVSGGQGTVGGGDVATVQVECSLNAFSIGGSISGLNGTVTLQDDGGDDLTVTSSGSFAFKTSLTEGSAYKVTVETQPTVPSQTCTVSGASGTVRAQPVTSVSVSCVTNDFAVYGFAYGLVSGASLVLTNNGTTLPAVTRNGQFTISTSLPSGTSYDVEVTSNPLTPFAQTCIVVDGSGTVGNTVSSSTAVSCGEPAYKEIAKGSTTAHACAIGQSGALWCWGDNNDGALGNGSVGAENLVTPVGTGTSWVHVAVGLDNTCGIQTDGSLWCWGANTHGQLGNGTTNGPVLSPAETSSATWQSVSVGWDSACGIQGDGSLWCWGEDAKGELGDDLTADVSTPKKVGASTWKNVSLGDEDACAIRSDDTLWCWGWNLAGALGDGTTTDHGTPAQVGTGTWQTLYTGVQHTCAIKFDGSLWCWGLNNYGQLGIGTDVNMLVPTAVGAASWQSVAGGSVGTCGVQLDGTAWCWGDNEFGACGIGVTSQQPVATPMQVGTAATWSTTLRYEDGAIGLRADGSLWGWGAAGNSGSPYGMNTASPVLDP